MAGSSESVGALGELALALPEAIRRARSAGERLGYCFSLLQLAEQHARDPSAAIPDLSAERAACGLKDASLDEVITSCRAEEGVLHVERASVLHRAAVDALEDMIALLALSPASARTAAEFHERVQTLLAALPRIDGDRVAGGYVSQLTRAVEGQDSIHDLVIALRRSVDEFQESLARDVIDGAVAYGVSEGDRVLIQAFMRGMSRTSSLKFEDPGFGTVATRSDGALVIQCDIRPSEGHLLVARISALACALTCVAPHLQSVRFFQGLLTGFDVSWSGARSREAKWLAEGEMYQLSGRFSATERAGLERFLERLGSRIVFLIDLNRARKRLRNFTDGPGSIEVLRWAVDQEVGPRAFLQLGGERLLGEADDVADYLEEAAFLLSLPPARGNLGPGRAPLLSLAALLVAAGQHWAKCLESAAHLERGSSRENLQRFLDSVDRVLTLEHQSDDAEREAMTALFADGVEFRQLHLLTLVAQSLEHAADALARCALLLRDHVLSEMSR